MAQWLAKGSHWRLVQRTWVPSQHLNGSSQLSVTPVPGDLVRFSGLPGHQECTQYRDIM